jgi:hypothetical protein
MGFGLSNIQTGKTLLLQVFSNLKRMVSQHNRVVSYGSKVVFSAKVVILFLSKWVYY